MTPMNLLLTCFIVAGSDTNKNLPSIPCSVKRNHGNLLGTTYHGVCSYKQLRNSNSRKKTIILDSKEFKFKTKSSPSQGVNIIILFNYHFLLKWQYKINKKSNACTHLYAFFILGWEFLM